MSILLLPDLSVSPDESALLELSRYRAGVRVRLQVDLLPAALAMIETALDGRVPHVWAAGRELQVHFAVGDTSDRAWDKVSDLAMALATSYGEGFHDITGVQIRDVDSD